MLLTRWSKCLISAIKTSDPKGSQKGVKKVMNYRFVPRPVQICGRGKRSVPGKVSFHVDKAKSLSQYEAAETGYPLEGNAVSQLWTPFSVSSSAALCRCWRSLAFTSVVTSTRLLHLSAVGVCLRNCCSCPLLLRSLFCCSISAISDFWLVVKRCASPSWAVDSANPILQVTS